MVSKGIWDQEKETEWLKKARKDVLEAFNTGEKKSKPNWTEMFEDVYTFMPPHLTYDNNNIKLMNYFYFSWFLENKKLPWLSI